MKDMQRKTQIFSLRDKIIIILAVAGWICLFVRCSEKPDPGREVSSTARYDTENTDVHTTRDFSASRCSLEDCYRDRAEGSRYCEEHTCAKAGCYGLCLDNGTELCNKHAEESYQEDGYSTCMTAGCYKRANRNSKYCYLHTCQAEGCHNEVVKGRYYCKMHLSGNWFPEEDPEERDIDDYDIEGYYEDRRDVLKNPDEAYDAFEYDEDAWEDYE